jgi:ATP-binding cassette subfamily F protein uup
MPESREPRADHQTGNKVRDMAAPPLLSLTDMRLCWGGDPLFEGVTCAVGVGDRLALVGRNGSGKSTLLKVMVGHVQADSGSLFQQPGASIAYLEQDPDLSGFDTLGDYARGELSEAEFYKVEMAMDSLEILPGITAQSASGGERRRAALAKVLAREPDLLLLDEPTNHLDINAIDWLESVLQTIRAGFVLISHDRAFLSALTRGTLWIDRGVTRRLDQGFSQFEAWRDRIFDAEDHARRKLEAKIRREEHWIVHGVSGRRKRNMRRVADLNALKQDRRTASKRPEAAAMALETGRRAGKIVVEAIGLGKRFGDRPIVDNFDIKIERRDRVAIVGPNGAGKTTLLNLLIGTLTPDQGCVKHGVNLEIAQFDQSKSALDPAKTLWSTLTDDTELGVKGSHDQVMVRGEPKHVIGYLRAFLFTEAQARGPVSALSGGERARLLLAKIMARHSNLLALDEPTNNLDMETLDLLQEAIADFDGAVLLVSHDRDFIDRIAAKTIVAPGDGQVTVYAGGYSDYKRQAALSAKGDKPISATTGRNEQKTYKARSEISARKLSYQDQRRLDALPEEIDQLLEEIKFIEQALGAPDFYQKDPAKFSKATTLLSDRREKLEAAEREWLALEEKREILAQA